MARQKKLPVVLTQAEVQALLKQPNKRTPTGLRNYTMMLLMYRCGLRVSEVLRLEPIRIDWSRRILSVKDGKGNKDRNVPIGPEARTAVQTWLTRRAALPPSQCLFVTLQGEPLDDRYVRAMVKREALAAGIEKDVHPHTLRHTYATFLLDNGVNIRKVQDLLGHDDLATTMIYTHVNPVDLVEEIEALG